MAIAGKVAITLSTENGGAWSADVTYDRLVAVKHNNNLYISRKTVANVEPPNDEFWFLALEGFGGDDVQALIDRMNELSDLIQAIIDGTQQVGNAKTLDGHGAEEFSRKTDLANYLPFTGGTDDKTITRESATLLDLNSTATYSNRMLVAFLHDGNSYGSLGFTTDKKPITVIDRAAYELLHTGNKPTGTYTGNGSATTRTIATGGIGEVCLVYSANGVAIVTNTGTTIIPNSGNASYTQNVYLNSAGTILMSSDNVVVNESGATLRYQVL